MSDAASETAVAASLSSLTAAANNVHVAIARCSSEIDKRTNGRAGCGTEAPLLVRRDARWSQLSGSDAVPDRELRLLLDGNPSTAVLSSGGQASDFLWKIVGTFE